MRQKIEFLAKIIFKNSIKIVKQINKPLKIAKPNFFNKKFNPSLNL